MLAPFLNCGELILTIVVPKAKMFIDLSFNLVEYI